MTDLMSLSSLFPSRDQFLRPFEDFINKTYDDMLSDRHLGSYVKNRGYPRLDILSQGDQWVVEVCCPGLTTSDVDVQIHPDDKTDSRYLRIKGKMNAEYEHKDASYFVKEISRSSFDRVVRIPSHVKGDPEATMKDGILRLSWNAPEVASVVKRIEVKDISDQ